jgi:hypothetical protein
MKSTMDIRVLAVTYLPGVLPVSGALAYISCAYAGQSKKMLWAFVVMAARGTTRAILPFVSTHLVGGSGWYNKFAVLPGKSQITNSQI